MAKVYEFPMKKELPKDIEERLYKIAEAYVDVVSDAINALTDEFVYNDSELAEVSALVTAAFVDGITKAVEEY